MSDQTPQPQPNIKLSYNQWSSGQKLTDEVLADYVIRLRQAYDPMIAEAIVLHHRSAAFLAANLICKRHPPNRRDDILSAAMLGLVQGTRWISEGRLEDHDEPNNDGSPAVTSYLISCAYSFISKFIEVDRVIRVPRSALLREKLEKAGEYEGIPCTLVSQLADELDEERTKNMMIKSVAEPEALCRELIGRICRNYQQKRVLELRMQNRTKKDIGSILGCTKERVHYILEEIRESYRYQTEVTV